MKKMYSAVFAVLAMALMMFGLEAHAAIDVATHLTPIGTEVSTDAQAVFTWAMPIIGTILAMVVGIKLLKRFSGKF